VQGALKASINPVLGLRVGSAPLFLWYSSVSSVLAREHPLTLTYIIALRISVTTRIEGVKREERLVYENKTFTFLPDLQLTDFQRL